MAKRSNFRGGLMKNNRIKGDFISGIGLVSFCLGLALFYVENPLWLLCAIISGLVISYHLIQLIKN